MAANEDRACATCGASADTTRLEICSMCRREFCLDCAYKSAHGRRFCSGECGRTYYFSGEVDDDESPESEE